MSFHKGMLGRTEDGPGSATLGDYVASIQRAEALDNAMLEKKQTFEEWTASMGFRHAEFGIQIPYTQYALMQTAWDAALKNGKVS